MAIYFVRNLARGAVFGVSIVVMLCLGISGQLPMDLIALKWVGVLTVTYAAVVAVIGVVVTVLTLRKYLAAEKAGADTTHLAIELRKVVYDVPNYSFKSSL